LVVRADTLPPIEDEWHKSCPRCHEHWVPPDGGTPQGGTVRCEGGHEFRFSEEREGPPGGATPPMPEFRLAGEGTEDD
jgi:hypothetical protein